MVRGIHKLVQVFFSSVGSWSFEDLFLRVEQGIVSADYTILSNLLASCDRLIQVNQVDRLISTSKLHNDSFLRNQLLQVYVKCGGFDHAKRMFETSTGWNVVSWTCMVAAYTRNGYPREAFLIFFRMQLEGLRADKVAFITLLQTCKKPSQHKLGSLVHGWIFEAGLGTDVLLVNVLINMHAKCGSLESAQRLFGQMPRKDTGSWNAMISAYVSSGFQTQAWALFQRMQLGGFKANNLTFMNVLSSFTGRPGELNKVELLHSWMQTCNSDHRDVILSTALLNVYSKCDCLPMATKVFGEIQEHDPVSLNAMIAAFALHGQPAEAFATFEQMVPVYKVRPDKVTFLNVLGAASVAGPEFLQKGRLVHEQIKLSKFGSDIAVATALVDMYSKCGSLEEARTVFDGLEESSRDLIAWNAMVAGYARQHRPEDALDVFRSMNVRPNRVSYSAALHACASLGELQTGREIHSRLQAEEEQHIIDSLVGNALIHMYSRCGELPAAVHVFFKEMTWGEADRRELSSWNNMLAAYTEHKDWLVAMELVHKMHHEGVAMDDITFVTILNAVAGSSSNKLLSEGRTVHDMVLEAGLGGDMIIATALLNMYAKCGDLERSLDVFKKLARAGERDLVAWNAMSSAYVQHELHDRALELFSDMLLEGIKPDDISFLNVLFACETQPEEKLEHFHSLAVHAGLANQLIVATVLVTVYGRRGAADKAELVFNSMTEKDIILWNSMMEAYVSCSGFKAALELYREVDVPPDKLTLILALNACAGLADLLTGRFIHERAVHFGFHTEIGSVTALVNMYAKCGQLEEAEKIFDNAVGEPTLFMWNALMSGYAQQGYTNRAIRLFGRMQQEGHRADAISFVSLLGACSQTGYLAEGTCYFSSLIHDFGLVPLKEHYTCMIDLFGRAGRLEEAEEWIKQMPDESRVRNKTIWETLLASCAIHKDVFRGRRAAEELFQLSSTKSSPYVVMANLCNKG